MFVYKKNLGKTPRRKITLDELDRAVLYSVKKYSKTYKLLEKYSKTGRKTPLLADGEDIERYFRQIKE